MCDALERFLIKGVKALNEKNEIRMAKRLDVFESKSFPNEQLRQEFNDIASFTSSQIQWNVMLERSSKWLNSF